LFLVVLFKWVDENRIIPENQRTWTEAKNTIGPVEKFLQRLRNFQVAKVNKSFLMNKTIFLPRLLHK
jgi:hypothetical protein